MNTTAAVNNVLENQELPANGFRNRRKEWLYNVYGKALYEKTGEGFVQITYWPN